MTVTVASQDVADKIKDEVDNIKLNGASDTGVRVAPQAWTREGRVD